VTALVIGRPPTVKTADQLAAERRDIRAARHRLVGAALDAARTAVLGMGFVLVLIAG
jgi:hypothetical protein